jgi:hypothetical protein
MCDQIHILFCLWDCILDLRIVNKWMNEYKTNFEGCFLDVFAYANIGHLEV